MKSNQPVVRLLNGLLAACDRAAKRLTPMLVRASVNLVEFGRSLGEGKVNKRKLIATFLSVLAVACVATLATAKLVHNVRIKRDRTASTGHNRDAVTVAETWNSSDAYGASYYADANRKAVKEFEDALEVVANLHPGGGSSGALERVLAATGVANWNRCSPELREAAREVEGIESGDSTVSVTAKIKRLSDLCDRYR